MSTWPQHIAGTTFHARMGDIKNRFTYGVDYVLINPDSRAGPMLFSRNGFNLASVNDTSHGGTPKQGRGAPWAREVFEGRGLHMGDQMHLRLLTQPRFLSYIFNPVSFWLAMDDTGLRAVIAEVNNTFGDRHSYICHRPDFAPITAKDTLTADKVFHVSPFQTIAGRYEFSFDINDDTICIRILHKNGAEGVIATLEGHRQKMTNRSLLRAALRRPAGALRTILLIHWQAIKLKLKGATYKRRPSPPTTEVS